MVRFKLKSPFMVVARDQIAGGLWYKVRSCPRSRASALRAILTAVCRRACSQPTWWDAFRKVPPGVRLPRPYKKKFLPRITFPEDRLIKCACCRCLPRDEHVHDARRAPPDRTRTH